jgi:hypothetical protein
MSEAKQDNWTTAGLMALGWMAGACRTLGRDDLDEPPFIALARALKRAGAQCDYVDDIVKRADAAPAPTPGDPEHPEGDLA